VDFIEQLQALSTKIPKLCDHLQTEEATKNALVMPFIGILGYDIFDPTEVVPEFTADVGIKKGEKVDYAVKKDDKIILLFECKKCNSNLDEVHASQLFRYFSVTDARVAVLTDGITYRFYTDLEAPNKMDSKPFMEFNMLDIQEPLVAELKKLSKPAFNLGDILTAAEELKYTREIKRILAEQWQSPSDELVKFFAKQLHNGALTQSILSRYAEITRRAMHQFINERINARLRTALDGTTPVTIPSEPLPEVPTEPTKDSLIETLPEETEGFLIVRAILREVVDVKRVIGRDTQSYFGILLDDNNRKPVCRLHFNRSQKYIGLFDEQKTERRVPLSDLDDIYKHADDIKKTIGFYSQEK
jgi:predicted type IV restriction endonuclease